MTRAVIFQEGVDSFHTGTLVAPGALKLPDGWPDDRKLPVVINFAPSAVIGLASEMHRDADNKISFEMEWLTERFRKIYSGWDVSFYAQPVIEKFEPEINRRLATRATIRGISYYDPNSAEVGRSLPL